MTSGRGGVGVMIIPCVVMVTLFVCVCEAVTGDVPLPPDTPDGPEEVVILNNLGDFDLSVHCKSKDDDLGVHILRLNDTYSFRFKRNFWDTTLFFCGFRWADQFHWFDIYTPKSSCSLPAACFWHVVATGPCLSDASLSIIHCYPWNKDSLRSKMLESMLFPLPPKKSETTTP
ncbi:S-protein homolog 5-like [Humulus lupulus]|uniref:S-protein homolog 5-like n=1 Tax=Humulus lupulus TaxID=3486 RepID=UPI002B415181|nr:S-protein homolog 5-like [Humulus lupulus]